MNLNKLSNIITFIANTYNVSKFDLSIVPNDNVLIYNLTQDQLDDFFKNIINILDLYVDKNIIHPIDSDVAKLSLVNLYDLANESQDFCYFLDVYPVILNKVFSHIFNQKVIFFEHKISHDLYYWSYSEFLPKFVNNDPNSSIIAYRFLTFSWRKVDKSFFNQ